MTEGEMDGEQRREGREVGEGRKGDILLYSTFFY